MFDPTQPRPNGPPQNRRAREIVSCKRRNLPPESLAALPDGFRGWHTRGYLPHRDEPGLVQFVTFRLADSFPANMRHEWERLSKLETEREKQAALEAILDRGCGECWLRKPEIAELTEKALRHFHGQRYELRSWVVMPNHVHALLKVNVSLAKIVESWKKYTGYHSNWLLGRKGSFWQADYWDTFMRDGAQEDRARNYIEQNPVKAGLVDDARMWDWSSARYRNDAGKLTI